MLKDYEQVIYIPMSSGLSGSYDTAAVMAREYQGLCKILGIIGVSPSLCSNLCWKPGFTQTRG